MSIELGGGIELEGFDDIEGSELVVVKKLVGRYVRQLSDDNEDYESLKLTLNGEYNLSAETFINGEITNAEVETDNIFVGIDSVLKKLIETV